MTKNEKTTYGDSDRDVQNSWFFLLLRRNISISDVFIILSNEGSTGGQSEPVAGGEGDTHDIYDASLRS